MVARAEGTLTFSVLAFRGILLKTTKRIRTMKRALAHLILLFQATGAMAPATVPQAESSLPPADPAGIVVESIRQGSTGDKAGLLSGDVLLAWSRDPAPPANPYGAAGTFATPFDLTEVFVEQVPRGNVTLIGRRGAEALRWVLPGGSPSAWQELETAPILSEELLTLYQSGREAAADGRFGAAVEAWRSAAAAALSRGDRILSVWLQVHAARALAKAQEWAAADRLYREALADLQSPAEDVAILHLLREQGKLLQEQRAWPRAEEAYERGRVLAHQLGGHDLGEAASLVGLGSVAVMSRGSKDPALFYDRALALRRRWARDSWDVAELWQDWAISTAYNHELPKARELQQRAVDRELRSGTSGLYLADRLTFLAYLEYCQGEEAKSTELWHRALDLLRGDAPRDLQVVSIQQGLATLAAAQGDFAEAANRLQQPLALVREIAPGGFEEAGVAYDLGVFERKARQWEASATHLCQAADIVESRRQKVQGNEETLTRWGTYFADYYRDCAGALVKVGRRERAFDVLEEGRARAFLRRFKERDLRSSALPPERESRRRELDAEYGRAERRLDQLEETAGSPRTFAEGRLREIRRLREQLLADSLPFDSVAYPEPLTWQQARAALDPGTILISFSVGPDETQLFVLSAPSLAAPPLTVYSIPVGATELKTRISALSGRRSRRKALQAAAELKALYDLLLRPAEPILAAGERLLIVPDGPLYFLPFAALRRSEGYLIEWKPLHYALSATMYAEVRKLGPPVRGAAAEKLVAFGDPLYGPVDPAAAKGLADPALRPAARTGLPALPATRIEVQEIARLFPEPQVFVGAEATKSRVQQASGGAGILHLAVHGLLNEEAPLRSALAFSFSPSRPADDGFLQAWEIMDGLHLHADLVTLSACDTALGPEIGGEGLIGLTRAFHYAGARSVLASLWRVADGSTAELMIAFYQNLRSGLPKDRALQAAQIQLIHSQQGSNPFRWAAFQLSGDWR